MKLVIPSCYAYRQCWRPWMYFFRKHWTAFQPTPVLLTERSDENDDGFTLCLLAEDRGFCRNLASYLETINDDWLLMVLDDHWICEPVHEFATRLDVFAAALVDVGVIRLHPSPGPTVESQNWYGESLPGTRYRISTAPSLWNRQYLLRLLNDILRCDISRPNGITGTAWDFEIIGTILSNAYPEKVLATRDPIIPFWNSAIVRGKWHPDVVKNARDAGATIDTDGREFLT